MKTEKGYCTFFGGYAQVYTLADNDGKVFYVGCTVRPLEKRIAVHISDAKANRGYNKKKNLIIRSLNYQVSVKVVDIKWVTSTSASCAGTHIKGLEKEWMLRYHRMGSELCNMDIDRLLITKPQTRRSYVGQSFMTKPKGKHLVSIIEVSCEKEAQDITSQRIIK
jgi:hypothetical protein